MLCMLNKQIFNFQHKKNPPVKMKKTPSLNDAILLPLSEYAIQILNFWKKVRIRSSLRHFMLRKTAIVGRLSILFVTVTFEQHNQYLL
mgnify:CR=1 FL=1